MRKSLTETYLNVAGNFLGSEDTTLSKDERRITSPITMKITYDREVDALYIRFTDTTVTTKYLEDAIALDFDAANHLAGIEILDAAQRVANPAMLKHTSRSDSACDESDS